MPARLKALLLLGAILFAGGCSSPFGATVDWPVVPYRRVTAWASAPDTRASIMLPKSALYARLIGAGAHFALMSDENYILVEHAALPTLLDWYEAMVAVHGFSPQSLQEDGFQSDRAIRVLRVFVSLSLTRHDEKVEAAPALGLIRVKLRQPWGGIAAGEAHDCLVVATEKGTFVLDPVSRQIRPLRSEPAFWSFEAARF
ncbi:MAG: hypothetical protein HY302_02780 [Opitutae bacterium]|nr:hypothetical protein [Opitutae bacterium]